MTIASTPYIKNILEQPAALADTLAGLSDGQELAEVARRLAAGEFRRVVLTGMGSSLHCFYPLYYPLIQAEIPVQMMETSELLYYAGALLRAGTLVITASQSGESAEIVRLLEINAGRAAVLAITNTPGSSLARRADWVVYTRAGEEANVSTKTYLAMQLVLPWLRAVLLAQPVQPVLDDLSQASGAAAAYLAGLEEHVAWFAERLAGARCIFYTGRGPSLAAACTAGLTTKESTHFAAEALSCAGLRHGPYEMIGADTPVVVFAGDAAARHLNLRLAQDLHAIGVPSFLVSEDSAEAALRLPPVAEIVRPVLEVLPAQMITLGLARLANRTAGEFLRSGKITTEE